MFLLLERRLAEDGPENLGKSTWEQLANGVDNLGINAQNQSSLFLLNCSQNLTSGLVGI